MSTKTEKTAQKENQVGWIWYAAFDNLAHCQMTLQNLQDMGEYPEARLEECPDGKDRLTIEMKREHVESLKTVELGNGTIEFRTMIKRSREDGFEFYEEKQKPIRISEPTFQLIGAHSLRRRHQRHGTKLGKRT